MNICLRSVSVLLIVVASACATGRLMSVQRLNEPLLAQEPKAVPFEVPETFVISA